MQAVAAAVGGSQERAEAWKLDARASLARDDAEATAARHEVERLGDEVRRSLAFYGTLAPLPESLSIHVSGGVARLPGLGDVLGERLALPVAMFSPLDTTERGARVHAGGPQYAQAYGLALRAA
jgi:Tfp pilus assembly PilM family ATPase